MRIAVENLTKRFGALAAVSRVSLSIREGEMFTLLGPSGCGKTTLLRLLAGFYTADEGEIRFGDRVVNAVPPHERGIGMVFQNYALWPHMTVSENVSYGLKLRKVSSSDMAARVEEVLAKVGLTGLGGRYPGQLSGGQQQRVALARALVLNPEMLLLDEPLSNLDAKIRVQVRSEIRKLQKELGITAVYVTHDQEEALRTGDRCLICMRPENVLLDGSSGAEKNHFKGKISFAAYLGNTLRYDVDLGGGVTFKADVGDPWHHEQLAMGTPVELSCAVGSTLAIPAD